MSEKTSHVTMVFPIDIMTVHTNPHRMETPFGYAQVVGKGNAFAELEHYRVALEAIADGEGDAQVIAQQTLDSAP